MKDREQRGRKGRREGRREEDRVEKIIKTDTGRKEGWKAE